MQLTPDKVTETSKVNHQKKCEKVPRSITMSTQHSVSNYGKRSTFQNSAQIMPNLLECVPNSGFTFSLLKICLNLPLLQRIFAQKKNQNQNLFYIF